MITYKKIREALTEPEGTQITTKTMIEKVYGYMKSSEEYAEDMNILDYFSFPSYKEPVPLYWEDEVFFDISVGGSEGMYADVILKSDKGLTRFATAKTLEEGISAMGVLGKLMGIFRYLTLEYYNANMDQIPERR